MEKLKKAYFSGEAKTNSHLVYFARNTLGTLKMPVSLLPSRREKMKV